ncbi:WG repeat-containing protein [Brevibacillus migulae]|uniref:WG repeat-containing protein n=1 Tax=Brevibacillus migulae TaxID=1644114 RepID=UPI00106ED415|nr:WG repeat-containing protein [Brevibacillus migulae]
MRKIVGGIIALFLMITVSLGAPAWSGAQAASSEDLYPFVQTDGAGNLTWGYLDETGNTVISPIYQSVEKFDEQGLAVVSIKGNSEYVYGLINRSGAYVVKPEYDSIRPYTKKLYLASQGENAVLLNSQGNIVHRFANSSIHEPAEGLAVFSQNDRYGYLDETGSIVVQPQYRYAEAFSEGIGVVTLTNGSYALIDSKGKLIRELPFTDEAISLGAYHEGLAAFYDKKSSLYGYIDKQGKVVIPAKYRYASSFEHGLASVNVDPEGYQEQLGLITPKGEYVVKPDYAVISYVNNGLWAVGKGDEAIDIPLHYTAKYALVNQQGQFLTDFIYDEIAPFEGQYASVQEGLHTYLIDQSGKKAANLPVLDGVGTIALQGELLEATIDNRLRYVKRDGTNVWQEKRDKELQPGLFVREKKVRPHPNYLAYYAVVEGLANKQVEQSINNRLTHEVSSAESFPVEVSEYDFNVASYQQNLLVIHNSGYIYPLGAAHGMPSSEYAHIDLKTGQFYQLKDLFKPGSGYEQKLNELILSQMRKDAEELGIFPDAAEQFTGIRADQDFYIENDALNIYFYPYDIGPYAAGFITFQIPFTDIQELIDQNGAFWKAFHE